MGLKKMLKILKMIPLYIIVFTASASILEQYDLRSYSQGLAAYGLKNISFEMRIEGLEKRLLEKSNLGKITDVYFFIEWKVPNEIKVEVRGLPKGFFQLKNSLILQTRPILLQIFKPKLTQVYRSFEIKEVNKGKKIHVKARDLTSKKLSLERELIFSIDGKLEYTAMATPSMSVETTYKMDRISWSHNKWVLFEVNSKSTSGGKQHFRMVDFQYKQLKSGFGFPRKIIIKEEDRAAIYSPKEKKLVETSFNKVTSVILFSNYIVNKRRGKKEDHQ